jgi:hypothetical protein
MSVENLRILDLQPSLIPSYSQHPHIITITSASKNLIKQIVQTYNHSTPEFIYISSPHPITSLRPCSYEVPKSRGGNNSKYTHVNNNHSFISISIPFHSCNVFAAPVA